MNTLQGKTAILYSRVSTDLQDTETQLDALRRYAKEQGLIIVNEYEEVVSGAAEIREVIDGITERPAEADVILVREYSRFSRDDDPRKGIERMNTLLTKYTIVISFSGKVYQKTSAAISFEDYLMLVIEQYKAASERKSINQRTKEGRDRIIATEPRAAFGRTPFGLKKVPTGLSHGHAKYIWEPGEDWHIVEEMMHLKADGKTNRQLSSWLSETYGVEVNSAHIPNFYRKKIYRYYLDKELLARIDAVNEINTTYKDTTYVPNPYKSRIHASAKGELDVPLTHDSDSGHRCYKAKGCGKIFPGLLYDKYLNEATRKALSVYLNDAKSKQIVIEREIRQLREELEEKIAESGKCIRDAQSEIEDLSRKLVRVKNATAVGILSDAINDAEKRVSLHEKKIASLKLEISNLPTKVKIEDTEVSDAEIGEYLSRYDVHLTLTGKARNCNIDYIFGKVRFAWITVTLNSEDPRQPYIEFDGVRTYIEPLKKRK